MKKIAILLMVLSVAAFGRSSAISLDRYGSNLRANMHDMVREVGISADVFSKDLEEFTEDGKGKIATYSAGRIIALSVTSDKRVVKSFIFTGIGDGTQASGMVISFGAVSSVLALARKHSSPKQRGYVLKKLLKTINSGEKEEFNYHGYHITANMSQYTGFMVTADRIK